MTREQMIAWLALEGYMLTETTHYWVAKNPNTMQWVGVDKGNFNTFFTTLPLGYAKHSPVDSATRPSDIPDVALQEIMEVFG